MNQREFHVNGMKYTIRHAIKKDAEELSQIRLQIDGETEDLDRERGEANIDTVGFEELIQADMDNEKNLFLVAESGGSLVGFSRCEGSGLKRFAHKVEFGVGVLKDYWGYQIGTNLLKESIDWAQTAGLKKMTLNVLETNEKAIHLYEKLGFTVEGVLKKDKRLSDGRYYNTVIMGRWSG
ncbi:GNAT family N-acetyltransferase [Falsibacillus albus]|uniref:GNAT family N-acetyltransferase n=1 Tax=Falsibacillus albus TaxID=2478915 RepID=A0A3L7JPK5_9BACI|nr:GNAT family N-acetyltransferase [Falsibacillus albus]RLQ92410.1 GNAT family N-acetyltransferase [Falsibacillus albus]